MSMASMVYILCAVTSIACAVLLWRGYRGSKARLLLWSCLCFVGLALNNVMLIIDLVIFSNPAELNLSVWRTLPALVGVLLLLYGLVWDQ
jgi:hypothetical protein